MTFLVLSHEAKCENCNKIREIAKITIKKYTLLEPENFLRNYRSLKSSNLIVTIFVNNENEEEVYNILDEYFATNDEGGEKYMYKEKRLKFRFFLTHFVIIIPLLATSIAGSHVILYEAEKREDTMASQQLEDIKMDFLQEYQSYYDRSVLLSNKSELASDKMLNNPQKTYDGIEILKQQMQYFDNNIYSLFVTYGTDYIYSQSGRARKRTYFSDILKCREESIRRGLNAIECGEDTLLLLYTNDTEGYMLYSYQTKQANDISVNFVVSFEQIKEIFNLKYDGQYYELETADGSTLVLGRNVAGDMVIIDHDEWSQQIDKNSYITKESILDIPKITIRLYYGRMSFNMSHWLYIMQAINIILITSGTVLSACISWLISKKRINEILLLEKATKGNLEQPLSAKNIYSNLQSAILNGFAPNQKLANSVIEHKTKLHDKTAQMIFGGLFKDYETLDRAFQELGFSGCPEKFFVGAVGTAVSLQLSQIPPILKDCLIVNMEHKEQTIVLFLFTFQKNDVNRLHRRNIAAEIRAHLLREGFRKIRIGMSQIYTNPMLIDCACNEAVKTLEDMLSANQTEFYACWETPAQAKPGILPDEKLLQQFHLALQEHNFDEAIEHFYQLLHSGSTAECTPRNQLYLRYVILQCVVNYLIEEQDDNKKAFVKDCINIDVNHESEFIKSVTNILRQCLTTKEDDSFTKMLKFIDDNYQNCNLSYEDVAAVGGISKTYLSKMFRVKLGLSYIEYLTWVRMDKACTLLKTTNMNVGEIGELVGYANAASFRRKFKEKYGVSASEYRKKEREYDE